LKDATGCHEIFTKKQKKNKLSDGKFSRKKGTQIYFCVLYDCNVSKFNAVNLFGEKPAEIIKADAV
jgi:hypothetical protein